MHSSARRHRALSGARRTMSNAQRGAARPGMRRARPARLGRIGGRDGGGDGRGGHRAPDQVRAIVQIVDGEHGRGLRQVAEGHRRRGPVVAVHDVRPGARAAAQPRAAAHPRPGVARRSTQARCGRCAVRARMRDTVLDDVSGDMPGLARAAGAAARLRQRTRQPCLTRRAERGPTQCNSGCRARLSG